MEEATLIREKLQAAIGTEIHPYYFKEFVLPSFADYKISVGKENVDIEKWVSKFRSDWDYVKAINGLSAICSELKESFYQTQFRLESYNRQIYKLEEVNRRYAKIIDMLLNKRDND